MARPATSTPSERACRASSRGRSGILPPRRGPTEPFCQERPMRIVTLFTFGLAAGLGFAAEGVAVAPDGMVYFSDITFTHVSRAEKKPIEAGHIWKFDPTTGKATIFRSPSGMSNGLKFDADGNLLAAEGADFGGRRVTRTDMKTGKSYILAGLFENKPFNSPNDMSLDEKGRIYFSDPRYVGHEPIEQPVQ